MLALCLLLLSLSANGSKKSHGDGMKNGPNCFWLTSQPEHGAEQTGWDAGIILVAALAS